MAELEGRGLGDIGIELGTEFRHIVREERSVLARPGDGDVPESRVQKVGVNSGIGVDEDTLGSEDLRTMTGDRIAMIEMAVLSGIEIDLAGGGRGEDQRGQLGTSRNDRLSISEP